MLSITVAHDETNPKWSTSTSSNATGWRTRSTLILFDLSKPLMLFKSSHLADLSKHISYLIWKVVTANQLHKRKNTLRDASKSSSRNRVSLSYGSPGHVSCPGLEMKPGVFWQVQIVSVHLLITEVQRRVKRVREVEGSRDVQIIYGRRDWLSSPRVSAERTVKSRSALIAGRLIREQYHKTTVIQMSFEKIESVFVLFYSTQTSHLHLLEKSCLLKIYQN